MSEESNNKSGALERVGERTVIIQDESLKKLRGFVQIPRIVIMHPKLSFGAKVTYGILIHYAWQDDFCYPAQKALAHDLGCSDRWVRNFLAELKKVELVDWKQQGLNRPNIYYILEIKVSKNADWNYTSAPDRKHTADQERNPASDYLEPSRLYSNPLNVNNGSGKISNKTDRKNYTPKTVLRELPDLNIPKEQRQAIAEQIRSELGDSKHSAGFHYLLAGKIPTSILWQHIAESKTEGANSPRRVFVARIKSYAEQQLGQQKLKTIYATADLAEKMQFH